MAAHIPLNALRAFETAARTGSFAGAAREMNVSSAAISQQVKLLEEFWGLKLFIRQGNRLALTEAGQSAYPQLGPAMAQLGALSDTMRRVEQKRRVVLSAPQSVVETWLAPKLSTLQMDGSAPSLDIRMQDDPVDFARDQIDLRIYYGHHLYSEYKVVRLFSDQLIAVAAPAFAARHGGTLDQIADAHLIHTDWGRNFATSPDWGDVLSGKRTVNRQAGLRVGASSMARSFAEQGFGVALVPELMAQESLRVQKLVRLPVAPIPMKHDYMVAYPKRHDKHPTIQTIIALLQA